MEIKNVVNAKEAVVDVAEHPIKYSLQNVKTFGNDAFNNMAVKEAFEKMKANMKATINARQVCIDNEYVYRTYKQKAIEGMKNTSKKIITPVRNIAANTVGNICKGVNLAYKNTLDFYAQSMNRRAYRSFNLQKEMINVVEALSLGSFSNSSDIFHLKDRMIGKLEKRTERLEDKVAGAKSFRKEYLQAQLNLVKDKLNYLADNKMEASVWKDKQSPEKYFQLEIVPEIKEYKAIFKDEANKIKSLPSKTVTFLKDIGTKIKTFVIKGAEAIANGIISLHDKASEKIADGSLALAEIITDTSKIVNRKINTAQMEAKSNKDALKAKVENIRDTNEMLLGIKSGAINTEEYMSEATKSMQADIDTIDKMYNPDAAKYAAMRLEASMSKDRKSLKKEFKKDRRADKATVVGKGVETGISTAKSALYEQQSKLLGKLNNILVATGEKALNDKIGTVNFVKSNEKEMANELDTGKDVIDLD